MMPLEIVVIISDGYTKRKKLYIIICNIHSMNPLFLAHLVALCNETIQAGVQFRKYSGYKEIQDGLQISCTLPNIDVYTEDKEHMWNI